METDSRQKILNAAVKIIARKGKHGTRMEEVAREADINRAMVYYYFSTKDNLYFEVLKNIFFNLFRDSTNDINEDISAGKSHEEIIINFIRNSFIKRFNNNPDYTRIMIDALSNGIDEVPRALELIATTSNLNPTSGVTHIIEDGIKKGVFRDVDPYQTVISLSGMVFIYFLSPSIMKIFDVKVDNEDEFINNRLNSIIDLIMNGIRKK